MSCAEYRSVLTELARRGMVSAAEAQSARGHAGTCAACRVYERNQERVSAALAGWAAEPVLPAPDLWARIEAESVTASAPRWGRWAVAAGVAVCLGLWGLTSHSPVEPAPALWKAPAAPLLTAAEQRSGVPEVRRRRRRSPPAAAQIPAAPELATEFLPVTPSDSWASDSGQVVRVQMPRTALLAFGLPMNPNRADEPVRADVVVGSDGAVRAIRFIE